MKTKKADRNDPENWHIAIGKPTYEVIKEMVEALGTEDDAKREGAIQMIQEDPLSVEVRSGWYSPGAPGSECQKPEEYFILLSTGGPASRIIGELDEHGQPTSARLEVQDWYKPWTEYRDVEDDILMTYAQQFYFGD